MHGSTLSTSDLRMHGSTLSILSSLWQVAEAVSTIDKASLRQSKLSHQMDGVNMSIDIFEREYPRRKVCPVHEEVSSLIDCDSFAQHGILISRAVCLWCPVQVVFLDGGLATELEARGMNLNDPLWSAKCLLEDPGIIRDVHCDYFSAGAEIAITATYQVSGCLQG
jgi:hypothetical protein